MNWLKKILGIEEWKEFWWPVGSYEPIIEFNSSRNMYRLWVDTGALNSKGYWKEMTITEIMEWRKSIANQIKS
jgi:hypothetical protein